MLNLKRIAVVFGGILIAAYFYLQTLIPDPLPEFELAGRTMGTTYSVVVVNPDDLSLELLGKRIQATLDDVEARFSTWDVNSELSRFNQAPQDEWLPVSPELCAALDRALAVARQTDGAFDPTIGHLVTLWGFMSNDDLTALPERAAIDSAKSKTGYRQLRVDCENNLARKNGDVSIDLSAYVKGLAVDQVTWLLINNSIRSFLVEVGGEVFAHRRSGNDRRWRIAIESPAPAANRPHSVITPVSKGVATSGDYRNFFTIDGVRYSHVIDPATGYPVRHNTVAVTVVADTTAEADIWATALLVMGSERGAPYASENYIAANFIDQNGEEFTTRASQPFEQYRRD